ncbi:MAG: hypothetical protein H0T65_19670, partial [Deltaproteobacteria bacterium]|nr:hypothetical protein [Deltaproteobacteria bacterium]
MAAASKRGRVGALAIDNTAERERQQLIASHVDVARNIARRLGRSYGWMLEPDDIQGSAMPDAFKIFGWFMLVTSLILYFVPRKLHLCEAATRFDSTRAEPFVAFAEQRIRGA